MTTFGLDVSHHKGGNPDLKRARAEGIEFVIIKATEGATFVDARFAGNLAAARAAGMLVAAYHYYRGNASAQSQLDHVRRIVPRDVPVIPDVEEGSGSLPPVRTFVSLLQMAGYRVPLLYLPRWYWQQIGSPDLRGLPPLWSSRYPDNTVDGLINEFARVPASYWAGYGGLDVAMLQFTSSARVAGYAPLDANAYRGTRAQLAALLRGTEPPKEPNVKDLLLAKTSTNPQVWAGNGISRRKINSSQDLTDIQYWIRQRGGDGTLQTIDNLDGVLGPEEPATATVELDYNRFVVDVINGLAAKVTLQFEPTTQLPD